MRRGHIRWWILAALVLDAGLVCSVTLLASPDSGRSLVVTLTAAALLLLWPLHAQPLVVADGLRDPAPLVEAVVVAILTLVATALATDVAAALRLAGLLLALLVAIQLLLALRLHPLTLTAMLLSCMAAPAWLAPVTGASGSNSVLAQLAVLLNPLSALASASRCDYLRSDWFYEHSAIGASEFDYPDYGIALLCCMIAVALLAIVSRRARAAGAAGVVQR